MTVLEIEAGELVAEENSRRVTGLLLPYGETGRTNLGRVSVEAGSITVPADPAVVTYNDSHRRNAPVGRAVELHATDAGIVGTLEVARTPEGDELLAEIRDEDRPDARRRLSAEVADVVVRAGKIVRGRLYGAAAVVAGAFPSAALHAEDVGDIPDETSTTTTEGTVVVDGVEYVRKTTSTDSTETTSTSTDDAPSDDTDDTEETETVGDTLNAARVPAGGAGARRKTADRARPETAEDLFATLAGAFAGGEPDRGLLAALDEGIASDIEEAAAPQWLGEVFAMRTHRQRFVPLFTPAPLNSLRGMGWRFAETTDAGDADGTLAVPTVGTYSGYPNEPTSTEVKTEGIDWKADRIAGANEFDRAVVDFDMPDFWRGFYREVANDASRKLDAAALAHMLDSGNYTAMIDEDTIVDTTPAYQLALSLIVTGVQATQERAVPTFAVVGSDIWRPMVLTERQNALEYLSVSLGLDPAEGALEQFKIVPSSAPTVAGKVLVGAKEAHTLHGPKTVRASTVTIANGGVQEGLFAYHKEFTADPYSFALVSPTPAAG